MFAKLAGQASARCVNLGKGFKGLTKKCGPD